MISNWNHNGLFSQTFLKQHLRADRLLKGTFGLEREGLRVQLNGELALTPHPPAFGDKLENPFITTDFSESQIEVITPICHSVSEAYQKMTALCDIVEDELSPDEVFWPQSIPCIIPEDDHIPIAVYTGDRKKAKEAGDYRRGLIAKYGGKKQLLSGIHYNFALDEETLKFLFQCVKPDQKDDAESYRFFKDSVYLKMVRGYLRYRWLIIYLTGCSTGFHESFKPADYSEGQLIDSRGSYLHTTGPSFRNSAYGYKNLRPLYPSYASVADFTKDIAQFVADGLLSAPKELYTQIRMKAKDPAHLLDSLRNNGIQYLEIRTIDLNVYDPCGISQTDMAFLHHFMLWLLTAPESQTEQWQAEALHNEEMTALRGFEPNCMLLKDGQPVDLQSWANVILSDMLSMEENLDLGGGPIIKEMLSRVQDPEKTYASRLAEDIRQSGFIESQLQKAHYYKARSHNRSSILAGYEQFDESKQEAIKKAMTVGDAATYRMLIGE